MVSNMFNALVAVVSAASTQDEGWLWWYWVLIGAGMFIVILAIILLIVLPKRGFSDYDEKLDGYNDDVCDDYMDSKPKEKVSKGDDDFTSDERKKIRALLAKQT
jgi:hypothetical protein